MTARRPHIRTSILSTHITVEAENCTVLKMVECTHLELLKHLSGENQFSNLGQNLEGRCGIRTIPVAPSGPRLSPSGKRGQVCCAEVNSTVTSPSSHRPRSSRVAGRETRKGCPTARRPGDFTELSVPQFPAGAQGEHGEWVSGSEARPRVLFHSASVPLSRQSRRRPLARWRRPGSGLRALAVPAQGADAQPCSHRGGTDQQHARLGPITDRPEPPLTAAAEGSLARLPSEGYRRPRPRKAAGR